MVMMIILSVSSLQIFDLRKTLSILWLHVSTNNQCYKHWVHHSSSCCSPVIAFSYIVFVNSLALVIQSSVFLSREPLWTTSSPIQSRAVGCWMAMMSFTENSPDKRWRKSNWTQKSLCLLKTSYQGCGIVNFFQGVLWWSPVVHAMWLILKAYQIKWGSYRSGTAMTSKSMYTTTLKVSKIYFYIYIIIFVILNRD